MTPVLINPEYNAEGATKFFAIEDDDAQMVYDDLFTHKPKGFTVYREDSEEEPIIAVLPMPVKVDQIVFVLTTVDRKPDGRLMARLYVDFPRELAVHIKASGFEPFADCELGQYHKNGIGEIFHLKFQKTAQPDYVLAAHPTVDPALADYL